MADRDARLQSAVRAQEAAAAQLQNTISMQEVRALPCPVTFGNHEMLPIALQRAGNVCLSVCLFVRALVCRPSVSGPSVHLTVCLKVQHLHLKPIINMFNSQV